MIELAVEANGTACRLEVDSGVTLLDALREYLGRQRKTSPPRSVLGPVYCQFTEGFDTTDVVKAKTPLESLR